MKLTSIQYEQDKGIIYPMESAKHSVICTDIVINKADKGSTTVVIDRHDYTKEGPHHLADLFQITEKAKNFPGFYRQLHETFQCHRYSPSTTCYVY